MRMQSELALRQDTRDEIQRSLEQLAKSSTSATRLVNQLLALARAENDSPQSTPLLQLELNALARNAVQDWFAVAQARAIDLGFESDDNDLVVAGNATMLRELLNNLIDNALRYTQLQGSVTVRVREDLERSLAIIEVEDNGPGIAAGERELVFDRFYRILGSDTEGSGLGLAIVREIAQRHDAEVDIFSNPRSQDPRLPGCLFRISFRLLQNSEHTDAA
jgi:two-component system sensor histidine kinase TctE